MSAVHDIPRRPRKPAARAGKAAVKLAVLPGGKGAGGRAGARIDYLGVYRAEPMERIGMVKAGLSAAHAKQIVGDLDLPMAVALEALNVPVSTLNRKAKAGEALSQDESERFLGLARLIGQAQAIVEESGDAKDFDARAWTARWLGEPLPALGGARPAELMDTMEGQALVADALARAQSGAYA